MPVSVFSNKGTIMKLVKIGIAAAAALMMTNAANAQEWSSEQSEVWDFVSSAWATHNDSGTWSEALDPAGYGWNGNYPVPSSREQMAKRNGIFGKEGNVLYYQVDPIKISVSGDTAIAYYYANIVETNHMGKRENNIERCADTLVKRDGKWLFFGWFCQTKSSSDD
jgi:hypothetical protein